MHLTRLQSKTVIRANPKSVNKPTTQKLMREHHSLLRRIGLGIACGCLAWLAAQTASAALTHRYSFTNDVSDSVGNANGTLQGNVTVSGGAANFDGVAGDYIELPPDLTSNYTTVTFEFWV